MNNDSIRDQIIADLKKADQQGKLRADRVREIVMQSVSEAVAEVKEGSTEIGSILKDATSAVIDSLKDRGAETQEYITASIEGAIAGVSRSKEGAIAKTRTEIEKLESRLESEEEELENHVSSALSTLEELSEETSSTIQEAIQSVIRAMRESPEAALMRKRYAQLQTQLSILRANLRARYGESSDDIQHHLTQAKAWYERARAQSDEGADTLISQHQAEVEARMAEAGTALAKKERQLQTRLQDLWQAIVKLFRDNA